MTTDVMQQRWCCLSCGQTFRFGQLMTRGGVGEPSPGNDHGLNCPNCRGMKVHPADGETHTLTEFHGEKGTLQ